MINKFMLKFGYVKLPKPKDDEVVVHPFVRKKHIEVSKEKWYAPGTCGPYIQPFEQLIMTDPRD